MIEFKSKRKVCLGFQHYLSVLLFDCLLILHSYIVCDSCCKKSGTDQHLDASAPR